jgi:hypothetical protein
MILTAALMTACEIDNYDAPDASLKGTVIDETTGQGLITEQPDGVQIRYRELSEKYPNAQFRNFWCRADGTYSNTKLFAARYEVYPEGAFVAPEHKEVTLVSGSETKLDFTVKPYVSIEINDNDVVKSGNALTLKFKLTKNAGTIQDYRIFATNRTPLVGTVATDDIGGNEIALSAWAAADTTITATRTGFTSGKYWVRVGARCKEAPSSRYNLSKVFEIQF